MSRYPVDMNVNGIMGENRKKRNKYDLALYCIFGVAKCIG
jgi:hypothetical protein